MPANPINDLHHPINTERLELRCPRCGAASNMNDAVNYCASCGLALRVPTRPGDTDARAYARQHALEDLAAAVKAAAVAAAGLMPHDGGAPISEDLVRVPAGDGVNFRLVPRRVVRAVQDLRDAGGA